jgi:tetratricopeptide (TPR) repeat protein
MHCRLKRSTRFYVAIIFGLLVMNALGGCSSCLSNMVPEAAKGHNTFCAQYIAEDKLVEAESRCKLAIEYAPKYAEPYNLLGIIAYKRGQKEVAKNHFKKALALKNNFAEAYNNLGGIFLEDHEFGIACDQFKESLEVDPGYVNARVNLGLCYLYDHKPAKSKAEYLKCLELDPNNCDCRLGMGTLAINAKDYEDAKIMFQKMTETCPNRPEGFYNLCWTLYNLGRCGDAVNSCMTALALKSDYIEARKNLAASYECLALQDSAVQKYVDQIRTNPGDPELHYTLGVAYDDRGLKENALNEFLNTIKLDPKHGLARYRAARIYDQQLHSEETIEMCKQFVDLLSSNRYPNEKAWCISRVKELQYR